MKNLDAISAALDAAAGIEKRLTKDSSAEDIEFARKSIRSAIQIALDHAGEAMEAAASGADPDLYNAGARILASIGDLSKKLSDVASKKPPEPLSEKTPTLTLPPPSETTTESFMRALTDAGIEEVEFEEIDER